MSQKYCPECEMVLAPGVVQCRFCDHQLPEGFWGAPVPETASDDSGEEEVAFNEVLRSAAYTPVPPTFPEGEAPEPEPEAEPAPGTPLPSNLAPPANLSQRRRDSEVMTGEPGSQPGPAPGASAATRAMEQELKLKRVTRGSRPDMVPVQAEPDRVRSDGTRSSAQIEAFDTRQLLMAGGLVLAILVSGVLWAMSGGQPRDNPGRKCGESCQEALKALPDASRPKDEMSWISNCVANCLKPPPEPGTEE